MSRSVPPKFQHSTVPMLEVPDHTLGIIGHGLCQTLRKMPGGSAAANVVEILHERRMGRFRSVKHEMDPGPGVAVFKGAHVGNVGPLFKLLGRTDHAET